MRERCPPFGTTMPSLSSPSRRRLWMSVSGNQTVSSRNYLHVRDGLTRDLVTRRRHIVAGALAQPLTTLRPTDTEPPDQRTVRAGCAARTPAGDRRERGTQVDGAFNTTAGHPRRRRLVKVHYRGLSESAEARAQVRHHHGKEGMSSPGHERLLRRLC